MKKNPYAIQRNVDRKLIAVCIISHVILYTRCSCETLADKSIITIMRLYVFVVHRSVCTLSKCFDNVIMFSLVLQCLNVLVQHGTMPDYHDEKKNGRLLGCTCRKEEPKTRVSRPTCKIVYIRLFYFWRWTHVYSNVVHRTSHILCV